MAKKIEILPEWPQWKREIAEQINRIGSSMKEASLAAKLGETFVRDALKRDKEPAYSNLEKLRASIGLTAANPTVEIVGGLVVQGKAQAGTFLDITLIDDDDEKPIVPAPRDPMYPRANQYALLVQGDSMNQQFEDGSYVTCINWADCGLSLRPGMRVHIERRQGHLVEVTIKLLAKNAHGSFELRPESTNTAHKPIALEGDAGTEIVVMGLVTGTWKRISY